MPKFRKKASEIEAWHFTDKDKDRQENLSAAIYDLERQGACDAVCLNTLKRVDEQLLKAREALKPIRPTPQQEGSDT